jgi:hypothetical protein
MSLIMVQNDSASFRQVKVICVINVTDIMFTGGYLKKLSCCPNFLIQVASIMRKQVAQMKMTCCNNKRPFVRKMSGNCQTDVRQKKGLYKVSIFSL